MITALSEEAVEYGEVARRALEAAGGDQLAPLAVSDPEKRAVVVEQVFAELGAWELDARGSEGEAEAAAALCRTAGYWALAYPVAERLARPGDADADALLVVAGHQPAAAVAGIDLRWLAVDPDGRRSGATPTSGPVNPRKDWFVTPLELTPLGTGDDAGLEDLTLGLVLPCWTLLGMLDRAMELTQRYVLERHQFGQPLAKFQGVQFQLTEAEVERLGLEELAKYTLWSTATGRADALVDAWSLRGAALRAAEVVFRVAHQLHGAIGFCDETPLSWVSRASVPLRRLPLGASATHAQLARRAGRRGLAGLYSDAARTDPTREAKR
jgi:hypothetical protein